MIADRWPLRRTSLSGYDFLIEQADRAVPLVGPVVLIGAMTVVLGAVSGVVNLQHVSSVYLIAVLISAARWGILSAIISAVGGVVASAFFFYAPIYNLHVSNPQRILDLVLFICVAIVTGHLGERARAHIKTVKANEEEMRSLYAFSRRLAVASTGSDILAAVRDHLSSVLHQRVLLCDPRGEIGGPQSLHGRGTLPDAVWTAVSASRAGEATALCVDDATGSAWLVRALSRDNIALGVVVIDVGRHPVEVLQSIRKRVDTVLTDATATLERLDVARALDQAEARSIREDYRAALLESVSHELRTPLASILGAASVLTSQTGPQDERLAGLTTLIHDEAERLDNDIQNLLDASRISSDGLRAHLGWADSADLVNAAVERVRPRLPLHRVDVRVSDELPLVRTDPVLVEQALRQIIGNAVKYSPPDSKISVMASEEEGRVAIRVIDNGMGFTAQEKPNLFERFYRSPRHQGTAPGFGLGLWIARAFVDVCGGEVSVESEGPGRGTTATILLPAPAVAPHETQEDEHE
jgi:two-component system, OmpR family, sensor histidine kinase KdpD